jgi:anti-sigma28 factor (negative regulator of flagellin synthesis)
MAGVGTDVKPDETVAAESASATADAIMLPSRKAAIRRAREVVQKTSEMRKDRIEQLSQALSAGKLILDSQLLADKLIGTQLKELQSAA